MSEHGGGVCVFRGTATEVGFAQGRQLGPRPEANTSQYLRERHGHFSPGEQSHFRAQAVDWVRNLPSRSQEELEGMALGAGLSLQRIAEWAFVEEWLSRGGNGAACLLNGQTWVG